MDAKQSATDRNAAARKAQQVECISATYREIQAYVSSELEKRGWPRCETRTEW